MSKKHNFGEFIAGIAAGGISVTIFHPLDLVKTRFQSTTSDALQKPLMVYRELRRICLTDGWRRGLYRGFGANFLGSTTSWGTYFILYNQMQNILLKRKEKLSSADYFVSSGMAGILTVLVSNPIWMAKTRLCQAASVAETPYSGLIDCWKKTYTNEGIRGLYRGLVPGFLGTSHGAVHFMAYENFKRMARDRSQSSSLDTKDILLSSCAAKVCAMAITYPYQTIRCRMQLAPIDGQYRYSTIRQVLSQTWKNEGLIGLYKGIAPATMRVLPATCVTFIVYENVSSLVSRK